MHAISTMPVVSREWRHQDHPVFTPLSGFFSGLVFVVLVPALFAAVLNAILPRHTVQDVFPAVVLALAVPAVLIALPHTRRFGAYFLLGIVGTAVAVIGVGWLMFWLMMALN